MQKVSEYNENMTGTDGIIYVTMCVTAFDNA